ncbi:MAG: DUF58 domain-containing protein [Phycisphaerales bacterium]|nr:DUF58 domain-containing protein [Phycisphaerales bacterium]
MESSTVDLLNSELLRVLSPLRFAGHRSMASAQGRRLAGSRGASIEIADFRPYVQGDDIRFLDVHALARFDQPLLRLFMDQRAMPVHIFVDDTPSMRVGTGEKWLRACQLAAALGFVALNGEDRLSLHRLSAHHGKSLNQGLRSLAGTGCATRMLKWLNAPSESSGPIQPEFIAPCLGRSAFGASVVISDFLDDTDWRSMLQVLRAKGQDVIMLQVLSADELNPPLVGSMRLRDVEIGVIRSINASNVALYKRNLQGWMDSLRAAAQKMGASYMLCNTGEKTLRDLIGQMCRAGILT